MAISEQIVIKSLDELTPYERNPRHNGDAVEYVANSIKEFGFKVPIVIDADGVIVAGHTRFKAAKQLGLERVPCIVADDLTPEQIKAFRLADNKTAEMAEWDDDLLQFELGGLEDFDMSGFGFINDEEEDIAEEDERYTQEHATPIYEVRGDGGDIDRAVDCDKAMRLIEDIENAEITDREKEFLMVAAYRHARFNYSEVAEYYAGATPEMQRLMEDSALVIIDFDKAIEDGYVRLDARMEVLRGRAKNI